MKRKDKIFRFFIGLVSMILGTSMVLSVLILINNTSDNLNDVNAKSGSEIKFKRNKQETQNIVQRPKPKPKPKKSKSRPPTPLLGLNSQLSGVDLGLPEFSMMDLNDLENDLLGSGNGLVMTDDTVDSTPRAVFQQPAMYPVRARARGIQGYVLFSLLIGITGEIEQVKIIESTPEGVFDEAASQSIQAWKFEPAQYKGLPVKTWVKQKIRFDLS